MALGLHDSNFIAKEDIVEKFLDELGGPPDPQPQPSGPVVKPVSIERVRAARQVSLTSAGGSV